MLHVAVIFGGRAVEHEVSVITGMQIMENLSKEKYAVTPVFISKEGQMLTGDCYRTFRSFKDHVFEDSRPAKFSTVYGDRHLYVCEKKLFGTEWKQIPIDVVVFGMHGSHGEDGALQGVFETNGIPYTGPGVTASAVGMDKVLMKDIFRAHGIPVVAYEAFLRSSYHQQKGQILSDLVQRLRFPMIVKPANLGSSIGIRIAHDQGELEEAIDVAMAFDRKILVEEAIEGVVEYNCAVMGIEEELEASSVEVPHLQGEMLSFDNKYVSGAGKSKITGGKHRFLDDPDAAETIRALAKKAFQVLDTHGNARVDVLADRSGSLYVNEINTLPGSCAFYLWEDVGYTFSALLDRMIEIALRAKAIEDETQFSFDADLFHKTGYGAKL